MWLVVEEGQGLSEASSYISENDAIKYLPSTVMEEWNTMQLDERIDKLIIASQFIDRSFKWVGTQKTFEQGLSWPRIGAMYQGHAVPDNMIPQQVKRACIMALLLVHEYGVELFRSTGELAVKSEKIGPIAMSYFEPGKSMLYYESTYEDINNTLRGLYLRSSGNVISVPVVRR